jgi:hypothetical protein
MAHPRLARIAGGIIGSGVFPDFDSQAAPLYKNAKNMLFRENKVTPFPGGVQFVQTDETDAIIGLEQLSVANVKSIFWGTESKLRAWQEDTGAVSTEGTGYSLDAAAGDAWRIVPWGNGALAVSGTSAGLLEWNNWAASAGGWSAVSDFNTEWTSAYELIRFKEYAIALNLDSLRDGLAWCDTGDATTWAATATNNAGSIRVRDLECSIYGARLLRDSVVFFSLDSMYALQVINSRKVFGIQRLLTGIGTRGKFAITAAKGQIFGWGPKGLWVTDGVTYDYIHTPAVKQFLLTDLNEDYANRILCYHDNRIESVVFFYPAGTSTSPNKGIAFNYRTRSWSPLEADRLCASDIGQFSFPATASSVGKIYKQSLFNTPPTPDNTFHVEPLSPAVQIDQTYGDLGYGQLAYGGGWTGEG